MEVQELSKIPFSFAFSNCVNIQDTVYIGGGNELKSRTAYKYIQEHNFWQDLQVCDVSAFTLGQVSNELVAVGGLLTTGNPSSAIYTYSPAENKWEKNLPEMHIARFWASVASNSSYLAVAGGSNDLDKKTPLDDIEVYRISDPPGEWKHCKLPFNAGCLMSSVLTPQNHFLVANSYLQQKDTKVYYALLDNLFKECPSQMVFSTPAIQKVSSATALDLSPPAAYQPPVGLDKHCLSEPEEVMSHSEAFVSGTTPKQNTWPWVEVENPETHKLNAPSLTLFDHQIIAVSVNGIHTFSTNTHSWGFPFSWNQSSGVGCHIGCAVVQLNPMSKLLILGGLEDVREVKQLSFSICSC